MEQVESVLLCSKQCLRHGTRQSPLGHFWLFCMEESPEETQDQLQDFFHKWAPKAPGWRGTYLSLMDVYVLLNMSPSAALWGIQNSTLACREVEVRGWSPQWTLTIEKQGRTALPWLVWKIRCFSAAKSSCSTSPWEVQSKLQSRFGPYLQVVGGTVCPSCRGFQHTSGTAHLPLQHPGCRSNLVPQAMGWQRRAPAAPWLQSLHCIWLVTHWAKGRTDGN